MVALGWACALLFGQRAARAQPSGVELGVRLGYGIPIGGAAAGSDLNKQVAGTIPIWGELGYRLDAHWLVGAYGLYGFGFLTADEKRTCGAYQVDCSIHDLRLGAHVQYHILPSGRFDPWVGLGFGYEWLTANGALASGARSGSATLSGWELANLQGGTDWVVNEAVALGPFVSFSFGQYSNVSADCSGASCRSAVSASLEDKALHEWIVIGLRGTFLCGTQGRGAACPVR